jgi:N-acetylneuraminate synthase
LKQIPFGRATGCRVIAEAGTGHGADLERALDLVDAAADAGADCVKFQVVFADEIIHPLTGSVALPGGSVDLYRSFRAVERDAGFYARIQERASERGILFLATAFGLRSARLLRDIGARAIKIASPELNHYPLLREAAGYGLPLVISSGVSTLGDIERAMGCAGPSVALLLHCVTAYPAPEEDYNLRVLAPLAEIFGVPVGVSDHSLDPELVPAVAAAVGAAAVEKHFTLSRGGGALDDPIALEPAQLRAMVAALRDLDGRSDALQVLRRRYGGPRVEAVLGSGRKGLAPSELANYGTTNRSLHAIARLGPGTVLSLENVAVLRTEKNLRPGLGPEHLEAVLGRRVVRPVDAGAGIVWDDLMERGEPAR